MKVSIISILILVSISLKAQINKIDHFFLGSPKAESLFHFFKEKFQLPVDWDYKNYGDFSSGAVTLGNVAFEFTNAADVTVTKFEAIALEPQQSLEEIIALLDNASVSHDTIQPNTFIMSNGKIGGWSNMTLKGLLPPEAGLFICDYKNRERVTFYKKLSADSLKNNKGGPLGILFLKEIVVGSTNFDLNKKELAKLPGIKIGKHELYSFQEGPAIRLVNSSKDEFKKIIIQVSSVEKAKAYLISHQLLGASTPGSIFIAPEAIEGLIIELTDK